jgi:hypothetical protein
MPFVQRDAQAKVQGCFAQLQQGLAEEFLPDDSPELVAFRAPRVIDFSDVDNLDKAFRALGRLIAQYTGKTPAQVRQDFMTIYRALP